MYRSQIGLKVKIRQSGSVLEHIVYVVSLITMTTHPDSDVNGTTRFQTYMTSN